MNQPVRYILDTGAILTAPEILAAGQPKILFIPEAVLEELTTRGRGQNRQDIRQLVSLAAERGQFELIRRPAPENDESFTDERAAGLDGADIDIVRTAINFTNELGLGTVAVVTSDKALRDYLHTKRIQCFTPAAFRLLEDHAPDDEVQKEALALSRRQGFSLFVSFAASLVAAVTSTLSFGSLASVISTFPIWATVLLMPTLGILLYGYRQRFRLSYGGAEFLVGVGMTYYVFFPAFDYASLNAVGIIQIVGGLYVMVRGLDNVSKGLEGTKHEAMWTRLFG
jgi:rRNA-processing protein FCF1